jgi:hypothetical protein
VSLVLQCNVKSLLSICVDKNKTYYKGNEMTHGGTDL